MTGEFTVNGKRFYPLLARPPVRSANVKSNGFIETTVKRKLSKLFDGPLYKKAMMIVTVTDREFQNLISSQVYDYADAIRIADIVDVSDVSAGDINIREED